MIQFFVPGIPAPAGSKRSFAIKVGGHYTGRTSTVDACKRTKPWQSDVKSFAYNYAPSTLLTGPLRASFTFRIHRPKGHFGSGKNALVLKATAPRFPASKPDALKLTRAVEDALTGVIYKDDSQIVQEFICKEYVDPNDLMERPGVLIKIEEAQ